MLFGLVSCTEDDYSPPNCDCNAWVREEGMIRTVIPLQINCETGEPINLPGGYIFLGCDNDNTP